MECCLSNFKNPSDTILLTLQSKLPTNLNEYLLTNSFLLQALREIRPYLHRLHNFSPCFWADELHLTQTSF